MASISNYYLNQAGGSGVGRGDFNIVVRPRRIQQGAGVLSNLLRRGFDFIKPILINASKTAGYEGINFATNLLNNMGKKPFSDVLKSSAEESLNNLKNKFVGSMNAQFGNGRKRVLPLPFHENYQVPMKRRKYSQSSPKAQPKRKRKKSKAKKKKKATKKPKKKSAKKKKKKAAKKSKRVKRRVKDIFD